MQEITVNTRCGEIEELKPYVDYLIYEPGKGGNPFKNQTFEELNQMTPSWNAEAMAEGVSRLRELVLQGQVVYRVYADEECEDDPQKRDVILFDFQAEEEQRKRNVPFVIMAAGGSYESVCSMVETFPTAAYFNKLGYRVFVLNYRVGGKGVMPKPLEDVAAAYRYICARAEEFSLDNTDYAVCGFSAAANLTSLWGTESRGYAYYGVKKPKALFPVYPVTDLTCISDELKGTFLKTMLGEEYTEEYAWSYDIPHIFTENYPPCYIVHCMDDSVVPVENSICLKALLDKYSIPGELEIGEKGEHGFGNGKGSDVEGWPERAIGFLERLFV